MTPYFLRLLPCTAGVGGTENEEYMKKIRPYLWRGGALVLAAALVVLLVLLGSNIVEARREKRLNRKEED